MCIIYVRVLYVLYVYILYVLYVCVLYSVNTQLYTSTVIFYIHSGHIMATCFDRKTVTFRPIESILKVQYNKVITQLDPISFRVKVKITYDEILIYN